MSRFFYRTTIELVVLSEDQIPDSLDPADLIRECTTGDYVLAEVHFDPMLINEQEMAQSLISAGSDPGFFRIGEES